MVTASLQRHRRWTEKPRQGQPREGDLSLLWPQLQAGGKQAGAIRGVLFNASQGNSEEEEFPWLRIPESRGPDGATEATAGEGSRLELQAPNRTSKLRGAFILSKPASRDTVPQPAHTAPQLETTDSHAKTCGTSEAIHTLWGVCLWCGGCVCGVCLCPCLCTHVRASWHTCGGQTWQQVPLPTEAIFSYLS